MSNLSIDFKVIQKEWDIFWTWIYTNTRIHHIGPEVRLLFLDPSIQRTREESMLFFLTHKALILNNCPKCNCKSRYIHIEDHNLDCPIKIFNEKLQNSF